MTTGPIESDGELTYALIHGGGDVGWAWHLVEAELRARGRETIAIDLPMGSDVGLEDQAAAVVDAVGAAPRVVVVGHSFGGFTAPIVADSLPGAILLVLVAGMVPMPGETPNDFWAASGYVAATKAGDGEGGGSVIETYYQDVDPALAREAASRGRDGQLRGLDEPWPLAAWPDVPTRHVLFRQDRCFPAAFMRTMVYERLGITPDEMDGSHGAMLSRPRELAAYLDRAAREAAASSGG